MYDNSGLTVREIFHFRYGICQMVYFSGSRSWIGLNEKKQTLWAPDKRGNPDMDRVRKPHYIYQEQVAYLEALNPNYKPDVMLLSLKESSQEDAPA